MAITKEHAFVTLVALVFAFFGMCCIGIAINPDVAHTRAYIPLLLVGVMLLCTSIVATVELVDDLLPIGLPLAMPMYTTCMAATA